MRKRSVPLVGPLTRASVFGVIALMGAYGPFAVMADEARREHAARPPEFWPVVWLSAAFVFGLCGYLAFRIAREAFPPKDTHVFPVLPVGNITVVDVVVSPVALLLLLLLGLFPRMWVNPMGGFGLREMDMMQLLIIAPMGAALLLWRPSYHVTRGAPIVRYPAGAWLPWKKVLPLRPKLEWRDYWSGKPRRQIGWGLYAVMGRFELFLELVELSATQQLMDQVRAEWADFFSTVKEGTPQEIEAALAPDKPVKPWHLMAAMFGLPGTPLALAACFQPHYDNASMGIALLFVTVVGGLALWFLSRFVSQTGLSVLVALLAAAAFTGVLTGRKKAEARALSSRVSYQVADVCLGRPAPGPRCTIVDMPW